VRLDDNKFGIFGARRANVTGWEHESRVLVRCFHRRDAGRRGRGGFGHAGSMLWPLHILQPEPLQSLWQDLKAALLAAKQDWQVWTIWFDHRLAGYPFPRRRT
jgi:hypothetical protein